MSDPSRTTGGTTSRTTGGATGRTSSRSASRPASSPASAAGIREHPGPDSPAGRPAGGPAAEPGESGSDWLSLADRIAAHATNFLDALAALGRGEGGDEIVPLLLLEVAQVMLAG